MLRITIYCLLSMLLSMVCFGQDTVYFSFASDDYHDGPTFSGSQNHIGGVAEVDLMVDNNDDGLGGQVTFLSDFDFTGQIRKHQVVSVGTDFLHIWDFYSSQTTFIHVTSGFLPILVIGIDDGVLTSLSPNANTLGETMPLQSSEGVDTACVVFPLNLLATMLGVTYPTSEDVAYTFTNVRTASGGLVGLDKDGNFSESWTSEGSFSASAMQ